MTPNDPLLGDPERTSFFLRLGLFAASLWPDLLDVGPENVNLVLIPRQVRISAKSYTFPAHPDSIAPKPDTVTFHRYDDYRWRKTVFVSWSPKTSTIYYTI